HIGCSDRAAVEHGAVSVKLGSPVNVVPERPNQHVWICRIHLQSQVKRIVILPQYLPINAARGVNGSAKWVTCVANLYPPGVPVARDVERERSGALLPNAVRFEKKAVIGAVHRRGAHRAAE